MKKTVKIISICMSLIILCLAVSSCGVSEDDVVGIWAARLIGGGMDVLEIEKNHHFKMWTFDENDNLERVDSGEWKIKGRELTIYYEGKLRGATTSFTYEDGVMKSGKLKYYRYEE